MKETKTVQVYPDDRIVNATISEYENFGWEVVGNQRCQEYEGQTRDIIGGTTTKHYSTFNKITFSREKDSPWYNSVVQLERQYRTLSDTCETYKDYRPVLRKAKPEGATGVALGFLLFCWFIVPGIIYSIIHGGLNSAYKRRYKKRLAEYEAVYPAKIKEAEDKMSEIRFLAERCITGRV